jgi:hypothetical protein
MKPQNEQSEIRLVFQPLRDAVPWSNRVRRLLKYALRACGLKCVRVEELPCDDGRSDTRK